MSNPLAQALGSIDAGPDPVWHRRISFIKSGLRIAGYFALPFSITVGAGALVLAEVLGVAEEMV